MATINTMVKLDTASFVAGVLSLDFTNSKQYSVSDVTGDDIVISSITEIVPIAYGATAYVYISNPAGVQQVKLYADDGTGDWSAPKQWGIVEPGEWSFFAVAAGKGLKIEPSSGTMTVNYVLMKKQ